MVKIYIGIQLERITKNKQIERKNKMKKEIESYTIVLTWKHKDGSWNTETLNQDNLPDSFLDYLKEYERVENE